MQAASLYCKVSGQFSNFLPASADHHSTLCHRLQPLENRQRDLLQAGPLSPEHFWQLRSADLWRGPQHGESDAYPHGHSVSSSKGRQCADVLQQQGCAGVHPLLCTLHFSRGKGFSTHPGPGKIPQHLDIEAPIAVCPTYCDEAIFRQNALPHLLGT